MKTAGLLYGQDEHYLDHIAPYCALAQIPLIVTDSSLQALAKDFYPDLPLETSEKIILDYDTIVTNLPRPLFDEIFLIPQMLSQKRLETIWLPHGNSDKGRNSPFMEGLKGETTLLTYGPRMNQFLEEKGIQAKKIPIGNYRRAYFQKHRDFYRSKLPQKTKPTYLYAPTWKDREESSSFEAVIDQILNPPDDIELIIKLHPNLYHQFPEKIEGLHLLENFPPIYPLLDHIDLLITDASSSIPYDFLSFKKPLLLFGESPYLDKAGTRINPAEFSYELCHNLKPKQHNLYEEVFFDVKQVYV